MNHNSLKKYINDQIQEILRYKWIESEKECYDIGENRAAIEWISKFGASYRNYWCEINLNKDS